MVFSNFLSPFLCNFVLIGLDSNKETKHKNTKLCHDFWFLQSLLIRSLRRTVKADCGKCEKLGRFYTDLARSQGTPEVPLC